MKILINIFKHIFRVFKHKFYVFKYCCKMGIPWQGFMHDWSKFSSIEFFESIKYYQKGRSPIDVIKQIQGFSYAWQHHKGHNPHHCEYWTIPNKIEPKAIKIPDKYVRELIADYIAAGKTYQGNNFTYKNEYEWWLKKKETLLLHPDTEELITHIFKRLSEDGEIWFKVFKDCYKKDLYRLLIDKENVIVIYMN